MDSNRDIKIAVAITVGFLLGLATGSIVIAGLAGAAAGLLAHQVLPPRKVETDDSTETPAAEPTRGAPDWTSVSFTLDFLMRALREGAIDPETHRDLVALLQSDTSPAVATAAPVRHPTHRRSGESKTPSPPPLPPPPPPRPARSSAAVAPATATAVSATPRFPLASVIDAARSGLTRAWHALAADLAVHGLAYLGVFLVFVSVLGLVVFAFSSVSFAWRLGAELAIPAFLFGAAWFLRSRSAPFVSAALVTLGGAVTPIVLFAAIADGSSVAPDLGDAALVVVLTLLALLLAAGYAAVSGRAVWARPLQYLAAPLLWTAVGTAGLAFHGEVSAAQFAAVAVAVAVTAAFARDRSSHRLGAATLAVVVPGWLIAYGLTVIFAATEGWPSMPMLVAGSAGLILSEIAPHRVGLPWLLQVALVAITATSLAPGSATGLPWLAATLGYLGLVELWARRPAPRAAVIIPLAAVGASVVAAAMEPWSLVVAATAVSAWAHWRRLHHPATIPGPLLVAYAAAAPVVAAIGLALAWDPAWAMLTTSAVVTAGAALARWRLPNDRFYAAWLPAAQGAVLASTSGAFLVDEPWIWFGTALLAATGLAVSVRHQPGRLWAAGTAGLWTTWLALAALDVPLEHRPAVFAAVGFGAVVVAAVRQAPMSGHRSLFGHLTTAGALVAALPGPTLSSALALFTAGLMVEVVANEVSASPLLGMVPASLRWNSGPIAAAGVLQGATATCLAALGAVAAAQLGIVDRWAGGAGLVLAVVAISEAIVARLTVARRPLATVAAWSGVITSAVAIVAAAPAVGASVVALAAAVTVVVAVGRELRHPLMTWFAWIASAGVAVLGVDLTGFDHRELTLLCWGALALIGAVATDDVLSGRRVAGEGLRHPDTVPPAILGALATVVGLGAAVAAFGPAAWPWMLLVAAVGAIVAIQLHAGSVTVVTYSLAVSGLAAAAAEGGLEPIDAAWVSIPVTAALLTASYGLRLGTAERRLWLRWDLAPFVVAHGVALTGMLAAVVADDMAVTWLGIGGLGFAIAGVWRWWPWAVPSTAIVLAGAADAGMGWLALALAVASAGYTAAATRLAPGAAAAVRIAGVGFAWMSWLALVAWAGWHPDPAVQATVLVSGGLAALGGLAMRAGRLRPAVVLPWVAGAAVALGPALARFSEADRTSAGLCLAAASLGWAGGLGMSASTLRVPLLREVAAGVAFAGIFALDYALDPAPATLVVALVLSGMAASVGYTGMWALRGDSPWLRPVLGWGVAAIAVAAFVAFPDRPLLVGVLSLAGVQAIGLGLVTRIVAFLYAGPVFLLAAWIVLIAEWQTEDPNWYLVPIGLATIAVTSIARWDFHRRQVAEPEEIALAELAGIALMAAPSMMHAVTRSSAYGLAAIAIGLAVTLWGATTRVRRRAYAGVAAVVFGGLAMVVAPLAEIVPQFRGVAVWAVLGAIGLLLLAAATRIERGRAGLRAVGRRLDELMDGWD